MVNVVPTKQAVWFGAYPGSGNADPSAYEAMVGRKLDMFTRYYRAKDAWPNAADRALIADGRMLLATVTPAFKSDSPNVTWAQVTSGAVDSYLKAAARNIASIKSPVFLAYEHEFDTKVKLDIHGPIQDFAPSYRHVHDVMAPLAPNIVWCWIVSYAHDVAAQGWPGDAYVDWIFVDPYDSTLSKGDPVKTFKPFRDWLAKQSFGKGKPLGIFETGVNNTVSDADRATWIRAVPAALTSLGYKAFAWFNSGGTLGDTRIYPNTKAAAAMKTIGADRIFKASTSADLGGILVGSTAAIHFPSGVDLVAAIGKDGRIWAKRYYSGSWHAWQPIAPAAKGAPSFILVDNTSARMYYARASDGHIIETTTHDSGVTFV